MNDLPKHIGIIMDGNRRWAQAKGLSTKEGHKAGAKNLENIAQICNEIGIEYLTVFAFSTENWKRSKEEVSALMLILKAYLDSFSRRVHNDNIRVKVIGDISGLSSDLQKSINNAIEKTKDNTGLTLNVAFNYGGRPEIIYATKKIAEKVKNGELNVEDIDEELFTSNLYTAGQPDPDLIIRTSNELRTSGFLLWEIAYSELYFTPVHWPDFDREQLLIAIDEYKKRNRRFGGRPEDNKVS